MKNRSLGSALLLVAAYFLLVVANVSARPVCEGSNSDSDGDGFGWENSATCLVASGPGATPAPAAVVLPTCESAASDSNGDGFGWENEASCRVSSSVSSTPNSSQPSITATRPICQIAGSDSDGDGFGWENDTTCIVQRLDIIPPVLGSNGLLPEERVSLGLPSCSDYRYSTEGGYGWENSRSCSFLNSGDGGLRITDVILVTGQSNALGAETGRLDPDVYSDELDSAVRRVYAFSKNGWGVASLKQIWDRNWFPRGDIDGLPANNFAFHFGKQFVRLDSNAVVGIIMITEPGAGIDHWDRDGDFFASIGSKVQTALDALPGEQKVRGILWHQGETDYYSNDYYQGRLNKLIGDFRAQPWLAKDGVFICGETLSSPVNVSLNLLNTDGDSKTGCISSEGLTSVGDNVHFDANSFRILGARYADKYQSLRR